MIAPGTLYRIVDNYDNGNWAAVFAITQAQANNMLNTEGARFAQYDDANGNFYVRYFDRNQSQYAHVLYDNMMIARNARIAQIIPTLTGKHAFAPPPNPYNVNPNEMIFEEFYNYVPAGWDPAAWGVYNNYYDHSYDYRFDQTRVPNFKDFIATANWSHAAAFDEVFNRPWSDDSDIGNAKGGIDRAFLAAIADYNALYGTNLGPPPGVLGNTGPITRYQALRPANHKASSGFFANMPGITIIISAVTGAILADIAMAASAAATGANLAPIVDVGITVGTETALVGDAVVSNAIVTTESVASAADAIVQAVEQGGSVVTSSTAAINEAAGAIVENVANGANVSQVTDFLDKFTPAIDSGTQTVQTVQATQNLTDAVKSMSNLMPPQGTTIANNPGLWQSVTDGFKAADVLQQAGMKALASAGTALIGKIFTQATGQVITRNPVTGQLIQPGVVNSNVANGTVSSGAGLTLGLALLSLLAGGN